MGSYIVALKPSNTLPNNPTSNPLTDDESKTISLIIKHLQALNVCGLKTPEQWAQIVFDILESLNQNLMKGDKALETKEEDLSELYRLDKEFSQVQLPVVRALKII